MKLDYVLALKVEDFLERRLQTCVYKLGLAKSIHHARVLIKQRHIRFVGNCKWSDETNPNICIVSESRSSTSHPSSSVSTPRSTLTSPSPRHSVVDVQVVSEERRPRRQKRRTTPRMKRKSSWSHFVLMWIKTSTQKGRSTALRCIALPSIWHG